VISIENTLVSDDLISKEFVCNIAKCKGACCVEGEAGAPLEKEEVVFLQKNYPKIKPYLNDKGTQAIEEQGVFVKGLDGDFETPLVKGKECAYTVFSENGTASCGIEKAHQQGAIDFQKPISCHLYPVRVQHYDKMTAVNYHAWSICSDACDLGDYVKNSRVSVCKKSLDSKIWNSLVPSLRNFRQKDLLRTSYCFWGLTRYFLFKQQIINKL
jgi:hypothetical protein